MSVEQVVTTVEERLGDTRFLPCIRSIVRAIAVAYERNVEEGRSLYLWHVDQYMPVTVKRPTAFMRALSEIARVTFEECEKVFAQQK